MAYQIHTRRVWILMLLFISNGIAAYEGDEFHLRNVFDQEDPDNLLDRGFGSLEREGLPQTVLSKKHISSERIYNTIRDTFSLVQRVLDEINSRGAQLVELKHALDQQGGGGSIFPALPPLQQPCLPFWPQMPDSSPVYTQPLTLNRAQIGLPKYKLPWETRDSVFIDAPKTRAIDPSHLVTTTRDADPTGVAPPMYRESLNLNRAQIGLPKYKLPWETRDSVFIDAPKTRAIDPRHRITITPSSLYPQIRESLVPPPVPSPRPAVSLRPVPGPTTPPPTQRPRAWLAPIPPRLDPRYLPSSDPSSGIPENPYSVPFDWSHVPPFISRQLLPENQMHFRNQGQPPIGNPPPFVPIGDPNHPENPGWRQLDLQGPGTEEEEAAKQKEWNQTHNPPNYIPGWSYPDNTRDKFPDDLNTVRKSKLNRLFSRGNKKQLPPPVMGSEIPIDHLPEDEE